MWTTEGLGRGRWAAPVMLHVWEPPTPRAPQPESAARALQLVVRPQPPAGLLLACTAFLVPVRSTTPSFPVRAGAPTGGLASRYCGVSAVPGRGGVTG